MPEAPPIISKRNHINSTEYFAERHLAHLPIPMQTPEMRKFLIGVVRSAVRWMAFDFAKGAQRGIDQVATLLNDPDYFLTIKERRRKDAERSKNYSERMARENEERRLAPTAIEIEREKSDLENYIAQDEANIIQWRERLKYLNGLPNQPKHIRISEFKKKKEPHDFTVTMGPK